MEKKRDIFDHVLVIFASGNGMEYIQSLSQDELVSSDDHSGCNLLHYLIYCMDKSTSLKMLVFLIDHGLDYNKVSKHGNTPSHLMCHYGLPHLVEIMVIIGANMSLENHMVRNTCLRSAIEGRNGTESAKILISNGYRLNGEVPPTHVLATFQQGVIRCRDVIVTLLGLKKRRFAMGHVSLILPKLDRFLIGRVLAIEIWTTRYCAEDSWRK